jgi:hypothetical protein
MNIELPHAVELYLQADAGTDENVFYQCFAADAEVHDEGRTIRGLDAIKAWKREAKQKYQYQVEPLSASQDGDKVVMSARLTGNFPGSPVVLTYTFVLKDDRITVLDIH